MLRYCPQATSNHINPHQHYKPDWINVFNEARHRHYPLSLITTHKVLLTTGSTWAAFGFSLSFTRNLQGQSFKKTEFKQQESFLALNSQPHPPSLPPSILGREMTLQKVRNKITWNFKTRIICHISWLGPIPLRRPFAIHSGLTDLLHMLSYAGPAGF